MDKKIFPSYIEKIIGVHVERERQKFPNDLGLIVVNKNIRLFVLYISSWIPRRPREMCREIRYRRPPSLTSLNPPNSLASLNASILRIQRLIKTWILYIYIYSSLSKHLAKITFCRAIETLLIFDSFEPFCLAATRRGACLLPAKKHRPGRVRILAAITAIPRVIFSRWSGVE